MADKKKPAEHSSAGPWLGITLELIFLVAVVAVLVYGADKPFTPTFLNLDYFFGKILVVILAIINFVNGNNIGLGFKIFMGLVTVFLIGFDFYLLLRIVEMEEEHVDHVYHHAIDDVHGGAVPRTLMQELAYDANELAGDIAGFAKGATSGASVAGANKILYGEESEMLDRDIPRQTQPSVNQNNSYGADKEGSARWRIILKHINSNNSSDWKLAIIEADTILDGLVERSGFPGETLGERMKNADPGVFRTLKFAKEAHFVRNRIAHDGSSFVLTDRDAKQTIKKYEEVFREFDYI